MARSLSFLTPLGASSKTIDNVFFLNRLIMARGAGAGLCSRILVPLIPAKKISISAAPIHSAPPPPLKKQRVWSDDLPAAPGGRPCSEHLLQSRVQVQAASPAASWAPLCHPQKCQFCQPPAYDRTCHPVLHCRTSLACSTDISISPCFTTKPMSQNIAMFLVSPSPLQFCISGS